MKHYSLTELETYKNNDCNYIRKLMIRHHLSKCEECRQRLLCICEDELLVDTLKDALEEELPKREKGTYHKIKTLLSADVPDKRR